MAAAAPMDMLRTCREQFVRYAKEHRAKQADESLDAEKRASAATKAWWNEQMVERIDATLREWS